MVLRWIYANFFVKDNGQLKTFPNVIIYSDKKKKLLSSANLHFQESLLQVSRCGLDFKLHQQRSEFKIAFGKYGVRTSHAEIWSLTRFVAAFSASFGQCCTLSQQSID